MLKTIVKLYIKSIALSLIIPSEIVIIYYKCSLPKQLEISILEICNKVVYYKFMAIMLETIIDYISS